MLAGKFIVIEGIDGSGLTTQARLLSNWLVRHGLPAYLTKEPSEGPMGAQIRLALRGRLVTRDVAGNDTPLDNASLALLFAADRMDHLRAEIVPKLERGVHVICDRYYLSSFAYQLLTEDLDWLLAVNAPARRPDLTILLQVAPEESKRRIERQRWHLELYENLASLQRIQQNYQRVADVLLARGEPIVVIDGGRTIRQVHKAIVAAVAAHAFGGTLPADLGERPPDLRLTV